jgi:hypothetical protein
VDFLGLGHCPDGFGEASTAGMLKLSHFRLLFYTPYPNNTTAWYQKSPHLNCCILSAP